MEKLRRLLFELSSNDRINILMELQGHRMKLSQLSRKLDLTVTEASRHLQRLSEVGVIDKDTDGQYGPTPYGELAFYQLAGLDFVTKHQDYFQEYDISSIPYEFVDRIGELAEGKFGANIFGNLEHAENEFRKAKEFIWVLTDRILKNLIPVVVEKVKQPFDFRFISPEGVMPPDNEAPLPSTMLGVQKKVLPKVNVIVVVTEQAAGFCLPHRNGRIDYRNIHGEDSRFRKWCEDLFLHYWSKAKSFGSRYSSN